MEDNTELQKRALRLLNTMSPTPKGMGFEGIDNYEYRVIPWVIEPAMNFILSHFEKYGLKIISLSSRVDSNGLNASRATMFIHPEGKKTLKEEFEKVKYDIFPEERKNDKI